jgi:hypothetical protein
MPVGSASAEPLLSNDIVNKSAEKTLSRFARKGVEAICIGLDGFPARRAIVLFLQDRMGDFEKGSRAY